MTTPTPAAESPYPDHKRAAAAVPVSFAVLTVSDTRTIETDVGGRVAHDLLAAAGHAVVDRRVVADEADRLDAAFRELLARADVDVVLSTGGTGIGVRDRTVAVVERLLETPLPGFGELFRLLSYEQIKTGAMLSRAVGGAVGPRLVFAVPGSPAAVELAVSKLILPEVRHLLRERRK